MRNFSEEYKKTSQKHSEAVLEYIAQFAAEDYLEEYRKVKNEISGPFVPKELDDILYVEIDNLEKFKILERRKEKAKFIAKRIIFVVGCLAIGFSIFVLWAEPIRQEIINYFVAK